MGLSRSTCYLSSSFFSTVPTLTVGNRNTFIQVVNEELATGNMENLLGFGSPR